MICASLYEQEIRLLIGQENKDDNRPPPRLIRYVDALKTVARYRETFGSSATHMNWLTTAGFFSEALEHGRA